MEQVSVPDMVPGCAAGITIIGNLVGAIHNVLIVLACALMTILSVVFVETFQVWIKFCTYQFLIYCPETGGLTHICMEIKF